MSSDVVVSLDHVSKLFYKQEQRTMKELIPALFRGGKGGNWFWALQDISLQVKLRGSLELLGQMVLENLHYSNLLQVLLVQPKAMLLKGRIAPLELGAGFHAEHWKRKHLF